MSRGSLAVVAVVALLALGNAPLSFGSEIADDRVCIREAVARVASPRLELAHVFTIAPAESVETEDGVSAPMGAMEVMIVRRDDDGTLVAACVDNEESARRFFEAPIEKVQNKQARER